VDTATAIPAPKATRPPITNTPVFAPPVAIPTATRAPVVTNNANLSITPLNPIDGAADSKATFQWSANFTLEPSQAFELVIWKAGQDALRDGRGWGGTSRTASTLINFDTTAGAEPGPYIWGVLLIESNPYKRLQYLGGGFKFTYHRVSDDSGNAGGGDDSPEPTRSGG